jgi:hypothetical protein
MGETEKQKNCKHINTEYFCKMCGQPPNSSELEMEYCPHCRDHTTFEKVCDDCEAVVNEYRTDNQLRQFFSDYVKNPTQYQREK